MSSGLVAGGRLQGLRFRLTERVDLGVDPVQIARGLRGAETRAAPRNHEQSGPPRHEGDVPRAAGTPVTSNVLNSFCALVMMMMPPTPVPSRVAAPG